MIATYLEALDNLTHEELEHGCRECSRNMEYFPKPGHIRKAGEGSQDREEYLGLPQLKYPDVDPAEREAALQSPEYKAYRAKLDEVLGKNKTIRIVEASPDRVKKLAEQSKYIREKYGKKPA
jgi:hypothetical protein